MSTSAQDLATTKETVAPTHAKASTKGGAKRARRAPAKGAGSAKNAKNTANAKMTTGRSSATGKAGSPETEVNETEHSLNPGQSQPALSSPGEVLGQVSWLMAHSPMHKHMFLSDLEWLVMPPLLHKQFRVFVKDGGPIAYASWAFLNDDVGRRMAAGNVKLAPTEWNVGEQAWLVDVVAPFGGHEQVLKELKAQVFAERSLKSLQAAPDGSGVAVVEW